MSSLCHRCVVIAALLDAVVPVAHAQTVVAQRARVAALTTKLRELDASLDSIRRLEDTIEVDGVRFVVKPEHRAEAEDAARRALAELERSLGTQDRRLLDGWVSADLREGWTDEYGLQRAINKVVAGGGGRLAELGGSNLRSWASWWNPSAQDLPAAHLDLVTSLSAAATRCFAGSTLWCARVLGIDPLADPWLDLYDAAGRRLFVARRWDWLRSARWRGFAERAELFRQCVDSRLDDACLRLLHMELSYPSALPERGVRSLVLEARVIGGEGTFTRLIADTTAPLGDRLAAAAGVPLDSLLRVWHARMLEAAPARTRVGSVSAWMSFLVVATAGALALRSTRWRLG